MWVPVAVRRVANCYTPFTLLYFTLSGFHKLENAWSNLDSWCLSAIRKASVLTLNECFCHFTQFTVCARPLSPCILNLLGRFQHPCSLSPSVCSTLLIFLLIISSPNISVTCNLFCLRKQACWREMKENFIMSYMQLMFSLLVYMWPFVTSVPGLCLSDRHTHTHLTALFPGLPRWAGTRKVKPIWILLKQETVSGSGIS